MVCVKASRLKRLVVAGGEIGVVNDVIVGVGGDGGSDKFVVTKRMEIKRFVDRSVGTWN